MAGAAAVGILSPSMTAMYLPGGRNPDGAIDRYGSFSSAFSQCQLVLVEGDSQTTAPKIEVWRKELGSAPIAMRDTSILAIVSDDPISVATNRLPRSDLRGLAHWILDQIRDIHALESETFDCA
jgi:molybdopterin-guanine dinucleotide biosynthesis protein